MTIKDYSRRRALTFIDLYSKGISMGMIAVKFNISRQRVWQIIRKYEEYQKYCYLGLGRKSGCWDKSSPAIGKIKN